MLTLCDAVMQVRRMSRIEGGGGLSREEYLTNALRFDINRAKGSYSLGYSGPIVYTPCVAMEQGLMLTFTQKGNH
jgi:hypothetical protein